MDGGSSTSSASADRYPVIVHVDAQTLRERTAGRCEIEQWPYELGVWVLCNQAKRAREAQDVPAEMFDA
jgi:hypothetical protein